MYFLAQNGNDAYTHSRVAGADFSWQTERNGINRERLRATTTY